MKESIKKMIVKDFTVQMGCCIKDAIQQINSNTKGIVYVLEKKRLVGVITDGDVRRFLLKDGNINEDISVIMNKNPIYLYLEQEKQVYIYMEQYKIRSLPILNDRQEIVKLYFDDGCIEEEKEQLDIPVVIMAGGKGTRLYPYTQILPKPLIPIGEKTITEHIMERFEKYGCNRFVIIVNYMKHFIKSYFVDCEHKKNINFVEEEAFLGTGGGLKLLEKQMNSTFFLTNCDILIEENYSEILSYHKKNKNIITMVCAVKNILIPYGTVEVNEKNQVINLKEKPKLSFVTNTGLYVLEPEFLKLIPENTFVHITDIIQESIDKGVKVGVYKISEDKWLDMGQLEELEKMREKLKVN